MRWTLTLSKGIMMDKNLENIFSRLSKMFIDAETLRTICSILAERLGKKRWSTPIVVKSPRYLLGYEMARGLANMSQEYVVNRLASEEDAFLEGFIDGVLDLYLEFLCSKDRR